MTSLASMGNRKKLTNELGFFFSCFKEDLAVKNCIENIRTHYPEAKIHLSSDGGSSFFELQDDNLKFKLYPDILGYVNHPEDKDKDRLIECCVEFLSRLEEAINFCEKEYIMYFEPDVLLRGQVLIDEDLDINGSYANLMEHFVLNYIRTKNPQNTNKNFGSCGGSIIKCESFLNVKRKTSRELLRELIYLDPRISNCDYLLAVLFSIHGYQYKNNFDFIEARRDTNWETTNHNIVHQYQRNYRKDYEGKYANA